jgi:NADH-quinone oxidoreductase subunit G
MAQNETNPEKVNLTIDGHEVSVPKGTTVLQAAESIGIRVPHYCYHPELSAPAMCRVCLVEIEGAPKLQPSCVAQVAEGQVVHTESEGALKMRKGVFEFYLQNHPLDCPICDRSGECKFQDYVNAEGPDKGRSREPKRVFGRDDFGGDILFYGDRCVMCTRCVRFMNEVDEKPLLTVVERGDRSIIDTFFDTGLSESAFAGNIVDICPVGALVSKDFLHKARAWDLDHTSSVCPNCSQGCNISIHSRDNLVQRLKPRANMDVNSHWMCDYGRLNYEWINEGDRLEVPLVRTAPSGDGSSTGSAASTDEPVAARRGMKATGWSGTLEQLSRQLRGLGEGTASGGVTAVASPYASNEELGALAELVAELGGGEGDLLYRSVRAENEEVLAGFPTMARRRELAPNGRGAELLGYTRVGDDAGQGGLDAVRAAKGIVFVLGDDLVDEDEAFGENAALYVYLGTHRPRAAEAAHYVLPTTTFAEQEGSFTNIQGRVQRFWPALLAPGAARPAWLVLGALLAARHGREIPTQASQLFASVAARTPAFSGLSYESIGTRGAIVNEPVALR